MGKYTAAEFITLIEERFASNKINTTGRKILLRDISSLLENIESNKDITISNNSSTLSLHTAGYSREYFQNGKIKSEDWFLNDKRHRDGGKPARIAYYESGETEYEEWFLNDKQHRDGGKPAIIDYYENGQVSYEGWHLNSGWHRDGGKPARIFYHENGQILSEEWWFDGKKQNKI